HAHRRQLPRARGRHRAGPPGPAPERPEPARRRRRRHRLQGADRGRRHSHRGCRREVRGRVDVRERLRAQLARPHDDRGARRPRGGPADLAERQRPRRGRGQRPVPRPVPRAGAVTVTTWEGRDPTTGRPVAVDVADGHIREVRTGRGTAADLPWLVPGFVDLQVNGYGGHDVNGPAVTPDTVRDLADALARRGTTTFVPTVITGPEDAIVTSLRAISRARATDPELARAVPFAHVEGPFIAEEDGPRGAHDLAQVRPPSLAELDRWQEASDRVVGMGTISPHPPGPVEFTTRAVRRRDQVA